MIPPKLAVRTRLNRPLQPLIDFLPQQAEVVTTAAFQATGSLAFALIYPIAVPAVCFILSFFLMPETRKMSIWEHGGQPA